MNYNESKTLENVIGSYRGEISGVILYNMLSEMAQKDGNSELAAMFSKLSGEEQEHAKVLAKFIEGDISKYDLSEEEIEKMRASLQDPVTSLSLFAVGEKKAGEEIYPLFSKIAAEEGYDKIAKTYQALAKVELKHGIQLADYAASLAK